MYAKSFVVLVTAALMSVPAATADEHCIRSGHADADVCGYQQVIDGAPAEECQWDWWHHTYHQGVMIETGYASLWVGQDEFCTNWDGQRCYERTTGYDATVNTVDGVTAGPTSSDAGFTRGIGGCYDPCYVAGSSASALPPEAHATGLNVPSWYGVFAGCFGLLPKEVSQTYNDLPYI